MNRAVEDWPQYGRSSRVVEKPERKVSPAEVSGIQRTQFIPVNAARIRPDYSRPVQSRDAQYRYPERPDGHFHRAVERPAPVTDYRLVSTDRLPADHGRSARLGNRSIDAAQDVSYVRRRRNWRIGPCSVADCDLVVRNVMRRVLRLSSKRGGVGLSLW